MNKRPDEPGRNPYSKGEAVNKIVSDSQKLESTGLDKLEDDTNHWTIVTRDRLETV